MYGDLIIIYPEPYSIYLRRTIGDGVNLLGGPKFRNSFMDLDLFWIWLRVLEVEAAGDDLSIIAATWFRVER